MIRFARSLVSPGPVAALAFLSLSACQQAKDAGTAAVVAPVASAQGAPVLASADSDMRGVLLALQALDPQPIETLSAEAARRQPTIADAARRVLEGEGRSTAPETVGEVRDVSIPGPAGSIPARVYEPAGAGGGRLPVVLYIHGGGWVLADIDTYDASARALANAARAIVVSTDYRHAPEHKFPAAHEDAFAAYRWVLESAGRLGGDPRRVAVAGESAGGNMAAGISMLARQRGVRAPVHQALIYPVAGTDLKTPSYVEEENAKPLNKAMMAWFFERYLARPGDRSNPLLDLVNAPRLAEMPPTTIVTAEIDPLRSEGQTLAERLTAAGVPVAARNYDGVTHEFFGLGAVVEDARLAQRFVGQRLQEAFAEGS